MERATHLRESQIELRRRRAADEDTKVSEIALIHKLGAMNKRIEVMERQQGRTEGSAARLSDLEAARRKRAQDKAVRDDAVLARRMSLETQRMAQIESRRKVLRRTGI